MKKCSRIKEFYKKSFVEKLDYLKDFSDLSYAEIDFIKQCKESNSFVDAMNENLVSAFALPYAIATNFIVNEKDVLIPMVTEEPSVVAAASNAAKLCRSTGGFKASSGKPLMIGQIHLINVNNMQAAQDKIALHKSELIDLANKKDPVLLSLGGGAINIVFRKISYDSAASVLVIHLIVDVRDAMGANVVNTMVEAIAPKIEKMTESKVLMKIVSNLSVYRVALASAVWTKEDIETELIEKIIQANEIAKNDIFRAVTHNKGIMNGIDAVAIATGNDFRAIEAGAHGFAALNDFYKPLTDYRCDEIGNLIGTIELPLSVGIVGGTTNLNPLSKISRKILNIKKASDLASIMACVGLAQNFAAVKAIVSHGIQEGHMRLHNKMQKNTGCGQK